MTNPDVPQAGEDEDKKKNDGSSLDGLDAVDMVAEAVSLATSGAASSVALAVDAAAVAGAAASNVVDAVASAATVANAAQAVVEGAGGVLDAITGLFDGL